MDVRLKDRTVSSRHATIVHCGDSVEVVDFGSRNGVRAGGARVDRALLHGCGSVELGRTTVFVEVSVRSRSTGRVTLLPELVGTSDAMLRLAASVRRIAPMKLPAMIRGESGSGKELVARAIHKESRRADGPFVAMNAATISRDLAESELFGHVKGAFTGAQRDRRGAFRAAHKGTLFLDEIGSLPMEVQAKLLRVVEEGVVRPLGAEAAVPVDVRLVVATCEPLEKMIKAQRFRADLYERFAVCSIHVPPLRDRTSDIETLCRHLLAASGLDDYAISASALGELRAYRWPGNVRELRNVIVQAAMRAPGRYIDIGHVSRVIAERTGSSGVKYSPEELQRIFDESGHNISEAARRALLPRTTMRDLLRVAGVQAG
jgi:DNA-binding NtrC family response regulator